MSETTQFFCRQPKSVDLIENYTEVEGFPKPDAEVRCALYSPNGHVFAYTQPSKVVLVNVKDGSSSNEVVAEVDVKEAFDLHFSPNGRYLAIWTRPQLIDRESGVWSDNISIFDAESKKIVTKWANKHQGGWQPQFTQDSKIMAKNFHNKEIHFFEVSDNFDIKKPSYKFKLQDSAATFQNFQISPGKNPAVAIFIPEKGGKPAQVLIYNIPSFNQPICSRSFFKAEKCQLKWNALGTALLALASTDHDTSNKSYYGETNLYLLGIAGSYERIDLKREGPIHDITWSPSAREFAVSYGYMPSETTFFDARGNAIHSLPTAPRNTIIYSPHGRFVLVAGFGNLQGTVDVYDRQNKFGKVCTFEASNTSVCEWSPCGRFVLTATTSPRLRVDNGLKVWHASGQLVYYREYPELFSITWKPQPLEKFPGLRQLESAPEPQQSAKDYLAKRAASRGSATAKPAGAYRPPHARNSGVAATSTSLYQKELQSNFGAGGNGGRKTVPGMVPGVAPPQQKEGKSAARNRKKKEAKKSEGSASPAPEGSNDSVPAESGVVGGVVSLEEKKIRSLLKKIRAIETLKMKQASGESLEDTQVSKINKEDEIRKELADLGWTDSS
ncbi:hypothetical_protein [Candidozyma auris]|uniref:hypothetical_protein n=1 Tax=Candidozyma auris TaxID=498019 RepID=UPI000D2B9EC5|nr:hypothetical_protein [[Candida] auris]QEO20538.1 hypothetical_protein [[Candida] auris]